MTAACVAISDKWSIWLTHHSTGKKLYVLLVYTLFLPSLTALRACLNMAQDRFAGNGREKLATVLSGKTLVGGRRKFF